MKHLLLIGIGGFFGAVSRHLMSLAVQTLFPLSTFPFGTLSVNVLGALLIGVAAGLFQSQHLLSDNLRFFITTGFLGAFTTFSTFSIENVYLLREGHSAQALMNMGLTLSLTLAATWLAYLLVRSL